MLKDIFIVYVYTGAYRTGNRYIEEVLILKLRQKIMFHNSPFQKIMKLKILHALWER